MVTRVLLAMAMVAFLGSLMGCSGGAGGSGSGGAMAGTSGSSGGAAGAAGSGGTVGLGGSGGGTIGTGTGGAGGASTSGCAAAIDGGRFHNCATRTDGTLWCWGRNNSGQLGDGTMVDTALPVQVAVLGATVARPSAGDSHTCARKTNNTVWCWGSNGAGRLGDGTMVNRTSPVQVTALGATAVEVSAGTAHTCARKADGTLWCWGANNLGALGDGTTTDALSPIQVTALGADVAEVTTGMGFTCARKTDNTLWCWGNNVSGQLGDGTMTGTLVPAQVTALGNTVAHVAAGYQSVCIRKIDGTAWCWGQSIGGFGNGPPVQVTALGTDAIQFSLHEAHACARKTDGTVWCWGDGIYGSLGDDSMMRRSVPIEVTGLSGGAAEISTGRFVSCARKTSGAVWCWGYDTEGELGAGTISTQSCDQAGEKCRPSPGPVMLTCP